MAKMMHITMWVPGYLVDMSDELLPWFDCSDMAPMGTVTRSDVLRAAMAIGLKQMQKQSVADNLGKIK